MLRCCGGGSVGGGELGDGAAVVCGEGRARLVRFDLPSGGAKGGIDTGFAGEGFRF